LTLAGAAREPPLPKIEDLKQFFPDLYRDDPVLVTVAQTSN
jgi:hypothetical protein